MIKVISNEEAQQILNAKAIDRHSINNKVLDPVSLIKVDKLPSGFKGYPEGTTISYKPLTLGELEALNSSDIDVERGIAMLLNAISCNTLPVEDLYYWDVIYIGIQRKLLAFGDTRGTLFEQCPKCGNIVEYEFDFTEIEFKECKAIDLPIITKMYDKEVEVGLLTIKEFFELDIEKGELDVYARMIKNLPYEEAYKLIYNATGKEAKKIKFIDNQLNYGIKPFMVKCDNIIDNQECGESIYMEVRSPFEVVFPEDSVDGCDDFEIQYGRK